jgi:hypothetical protein
MQIVTGVTTLRSVKECICMFEKWLVIVPAFLLTVSPQSPSDLSTNMKCVLLAKYTMQLTLPTFM